jgi:hypothetical protein
VAALGSVILFLGLLVREAVYRPKIILPLVLVAISCAPMILVHSSELYSSMLAPFVVSIVLLFDASKRYWLSMAYGLLLYGASLGNAIVYCLDADFNLPGLNRLQYSIYSKEYQRDPTCSIGKTSHVVGDRTADIDLPGWPGVKGRIICIR